MDIQGGIYRGWTTEEVVASRWFAEKEDSDYSFRAKTYKAITQRIDDFEDSPAAEKYLTDSKYRLPPELLDDFKIKLRDLMIDFFGPGVSPVDVKVIDRTRENKFNYYPTTDRDKHGVSDERLQLLAVNLDIANCELQAELRHRLLTVPKS